MFDEGISLDFQDFLWLNECVVFAEETKIERKLK